jgi:DNA polymerase
MPLKYYGAHTGRWSGSDGLNPQNFTRNSELRKSIIAPPGYVILVSDLKQIEARLNMWFCGEEHWLSVFAAGKDIYTATAATHFGILYEEVAKSERFFGKTLELGLGYNMGWKKFRVQAALKNTFLTEEEAYRAVFTYRNAHPRLVVTWRDLSNMLPHMYQEGCAQEKNPVKFVHEGILLPNGMRLDYSGLRPTEDGDWFYGIGKNIKIYGGKMLENIIQALARIVIGEQLLAVEALPGVTTVSSTHDEIIALVREADADAAVEAVTEIMTASPEWAPDLPLAVDIGYAKEYSK